MNSGSKIRELLQEKKSLGCSILAILCIVLLVMAFFNVHIMGLNRSFLGGIDVGEYFYWYETFIKKTFLSGSIPLWNPYYYCGQPFLANPQTFIMYPATALYILLPLPLAFNLDILIHILMAAIGMFLLVQFITSSMAAGIASALVFSLSGYFMDNLFAGHITMIHTAALIPWIFYLIEKAITAQGPCLGDAGDHKQTKQRPPSEEGGGRKTRIKSEEVILREPRAMNGHRTYRYCMLAGLALGIQILGGEPQNSYYTTLFLTLYFFLRHIIANGSVSLKLLGTVVPQYLVIIVAAFCLAAIQIFPTLEFFSLCDRSEKNFAFSSVFSFPPQNFFTFLIPRPESAHALSSFRDLVVNWEFSGYMSIPAVVAAIIGATYTEHRRYRVIFAGLAVFAATVFLGSYTPLYQVYYTVIPGLSLFRIPSRCILFFIFPLAILVGMGIQVLQEKDLTRKLITFISLVLTGVLALILAGSALFNIPLSSIQIKQALAILALTTAAVWVLFFSRKKVLVYVLTALFFFDLFFVYHGVIPVLHEDTLLERYEYEPLFQGPPSSYRVALPVGMLRGIYYEYHGLNGYAPIVLKDFFAYVHSMAGIPVNYLARSSLSDELFKASLPFSSRIFGIKYAIVRTPQGYQMLTAREYQPRASLMREAIFTDRFEDHLQYLKNPSFNPMKTVLLMQSSKDYVMAGNLQAGPPGQDRVNIVSYSPNRIDLESSSPSTTILLLSELYYPGWKAYVDGRKTPVLRADYLLRAVKLDAGNHSISMVYRPMSFIVGASITLCTMLVLAAALLWGKVSGRKRVPDG
jgi:hypothetical protein